ncbi:MAG TPA: hypothetical protein VFZ41_04965 [Solirubrobacterales bacterium]
MSKLVATAALAIALAVPAVAAAEPPTPYPGNSEPGLDRYEEIAAHPNPDAQCGTGAGSGAFGYFGKGSSLAGGADGYQTGLNNSAVCGNRP